MLNDNTPDGGLYIIWLSDTHYYGGRTTDFKRRWRNHLRALRGGDHDNTRMQRVFNIHGRFNPQALKVLAQADHKDVEQAWLDENFRKPGCVNINPRACGGCAGHSAETRAKMSRTRKSRPDLVQKARVSLEENRKGITPEAIRRRAKKTGDLLRGRKQLPEHVEKRAATHRGRKNTADTKSLMSESAKRRCLEHPHTHSPDTRYLISSQQKGRIWINDGKVNRRLFFAEAKRLLTSGWVQGRVAR